MKLQDFATRLVPMPTEDVIKRTQFRTPTPDLALKVSLTPNLRYTAIISHILEAGVEGDIVELGCGKGDNTLEFCLHLRGFNSSKVVYGFDTFTGYTDEDIRSAGGVRLQKDLLKVQGRWIVNKEQVLSRLDYFDLLDKFCLVEGDISETSAHFSKFLGSEKKKISLLYIDCNVYRPAKNAIDSLKEHFSDGCLVFVDSGFHGGQQGIEQPLNGEHKALLEYCQETGHNMYSTCFGNFSSFFVEVLAPGSQRIPIGREP